MKKLLSLIVLFIIAAIVLTLIQYFQRNNKAATESEGPFVKSTTTTPVDKNPLLSPSQEAALEKIGIDPATFPSKITPEMEACFISKIGAQRFADIKAGGLPTAGEVIIGRTCLTTS